MKRSTSAPRSYLHRLAEPAPPRTALLTTRHPAFLGQSVREAIPPIIDSISEVVTANPAGRQAPPRTIPTTRAQTSTAKSFPVDASDHSADRPAQISTNAHPAADLDSSTPVVHNRSITGQRGRQTVFDTLTTDSLHHHPSQTANEDLAAQSEFRIQENSASPKRDAARRNSASEAATFEHITPPVAVRTGPIPVARDQGTHIHIGSVEVRTTAPVREPQPAPRDNRRSHIGREALAAEPLARPLAWSHGLVQG